jgi:GTP-binding protein EngB required for normal cell division
MGSNSIDQYNEHWIKAGSLFVDLPGMGKGFREMKRYRREIWDYLQYREGLVKWPSMNEAARKSLKGEHYEEKN